MGPNIILITYMPFFVFYYRSCFNSTWLLLLLLQGGACLEILLYKQNSQFNTMTYITSEFLSMKTGAPSCWTAGLAVCHSTGVAWHNAGTDCCSQSIMVFGDHCGKKVIKARWRFSADLASAEILPWWISLLYSSSAVKILNQFTNAILINAV